MMWYSSTYHLLKCIRGFPYTMYFNTIYLNQPALFICIQCTLFYNVILTIVSSKYRIHDLHGNAIWLILPLQDNSNPKCNLQHSLHASLSILDWNKVSQVVWRQVVSCHNVTMLLAYYNQYKYSTSYNCPITCKYKYLYSTLHLLLK